jgi:hypothetical protein
MEAKAETDDRIDVGSDREASTDTPRWVPILAIVVAIGVLVLIVVAHISGAMGPGLHS